MPKCNICPRNCNVDRKFQKGACKCGEQILVNTYQLHYWEEPPISAKHGSGTIFFAGCNMNCVYCQNYIISQQIEGEPVSISQLVKIFFELQEKGAHNINLVTPTHFSLQLKEALSIAKKDKLKIPVVWNSNAFEKVETLKLLEGLVDIYLPDFRYFDNSVALKYSNAPQYPEFAKLAIKEMFRQVGYLQENRGIAVKGILIRILVLPGDIGNAKEILKWIASNIGTESYISLMGQYYPTYRAKEFPELSRHLLEYQDIADFAEKLGFCNGFFQEVGSSSEYTPNFKANEKIND
ncbi:MAG: radical SAM protein [Candidatus Nanoarchaeia archaeon]